MAEILEQDEAEGRPEDAVESHAGARASADVVEDPDAQAGDVELASVETEPISGSTATLRKRRIFRRPLFLIVASVILILGLIFGIRYWLYARSHESTDDAFIDGHVVQVSPKIAGYVAKVYVTDNQEVKEGDLIAEIDARDYETRLQQAQA